jgi:hypothetical protein
MGSSLETKAMCCLFQKRGVVAVDACVENMGVFFQHLIGLSGTRCNGV